MTTLSTRSGISTVTATSGPGPWRRYSSGTRTSPSLRSSTPKRSRFEPIADTRKPRQCRPVATEIHLDQVQRWMQAFIVHPGTDEEALETASAEGISGEEVPRVVLPSSALTAIERVGIYRRMVSTEAGGDPRGGLPCGPAFPRKRSLHGAGERLCSRLPIAQLYVEPVGGSLARVHTLGQTAFLVGNFFTI